ncbi:DUF4279 domain-containing protein [Metasolibacillus meyeri]|uniref:DUF4279 domain-containing protein n=1 Tax=Metasolibacillus meyeri TaxID=1071052 RepID=A0AAW9NMV7_9BACL|nr:DUF4279 domain-containing protein [Metasolibacillus meyeri]MEC1177777.1 DUF4279 domain-containing protein [Metasolibacillus meyeri]
MEKTSLYAYIKLTGNDDFPIATVTEQLNVQPTETWKVGDAIRPNHPHKWAYTCWKYETKQIETLDSEDVLRPLLNTFQSKVEIINNLKTELHLDVQLELVIIMEEGRTPGLVIYPEFSTFAAAINAFLDIDMYINPFTEQNE